MSVLRTICKNPDTGLFWAGDTAQTISVGSAFRFNDLKAFLYRVEVKYMYYVLESLGLIDLTDIRVDALWFS